MKIQNCGGKSNEDAAVKISQVAEFHMVNVVVEKSKGYGVLASYGVSHYNGRNYYLYYNNSKFLLNISHSHFEGMIKSKAINSSGIHISTNSSSLHVHINGCSFNNSSKGHLSVQVRISSLQVTNTSIYIFNCIFKSGTAAFGAGLYYSILPYGFSEFQSNCHESVSVNILRLERCNFVRNTAYHSAGGLSLHLRDHNCGINNIVEVSNCCFVNNSITSNIIINSTGAAILAIGYFSPSFGSPLGRVGRNTLKIIKSHFNGNFIGSSKDCPKGSIVQIIGIQHAEISNCNFSSNNGSALSLQSASAVFSGKVIFEYNYATFGGAIQLCETSYFFIKNFTTVNFINNVACQMGGAIFDHDSCLDWHNYCFFQPITTGDITNLKYLHMMKMKFVNNTAVRAGKDIYGGNIDHCYTFGSFNYTAYESISGNYLSQHVFDSITDFSESNGISSDPYRIIYCNYANITYKSVSISPGSTLQQCFQPVGQRGGYSNGVIEVVFSDSNITNVTINNFLVSDSIQQNINVTILSSKVNLALNLTFQLQKFIPIEDTEPATLQIKIIQCPWGFYLNIYTKRCDGVLQGLVHSCDCDFISLHIVCNNTDKWIGYKHVSDGNNKSRSIGYANCHKDFCNQNYALSDPADLNSRCAVGRTGVGCGKCQTNYSAVLGTFACKMCSNSYLWLILIYFGTGPLLIGALIKLDIHIGNGALHGILFYTNFIHASSEFFYPKHHNKQFTRILIAWLNLDLGIEVCFFRGMTSYTKLWLEIGYVAYLICLQLLVIYLCHKYVRFTHICGRNVTKVLATILLMCFMKCLLWVKNVLSIHPFYYSHGDSPCCNHSVLLWTYDPTITLYSAYYLPLAVAAIIIGFTLLIFTSSLLLIQTLKKVSNKIISKWVSFSKPFFEVYTGPCNSIYSFWPGFLLALRVGIVIVHSVNVNHHSLPNIMLEFCILNVLAVILVIIYPGGVYKKWSLNVFETTMFINLAFLSGTSVSTKYKKHPHSVLNLTYISLGLFIFSVFACNIKLIYKNVKHCHKHFLQTMTVAFKWKYPEGTSSEYLRSHSRHVTHSEIQVPDNESSPLLHVSSVASSN